MTNPGGSDIKELKELILGLDKRFSTLDKKIDLQKPELEKKIETGFAEIKGEIKRLDEKIEGQVGKLEEKINDIGKRLENEEGLSRIAFSALIVGSIAGFIKYLFFSNNP